MYSGPKWSLIVVTEILILQYLQGYLQLLADKYRWLLMITCKLKRTKFSKYNAKITHSFMEWGQCFQCAWKLHWNWQTFGHRMYKSITCLLCGGEEILIYKHIHFPVPQNKLFCMNAKSKGDFPIKTSQKMTHCTIYIYIKP